MVSETSVNMKKLLKKAFKWNLLSCDFYGWNQSYSNSKRKKRKKEKGNLPYFSASVCFDWVGVLLLCIWDVLVLFIIYFFYYM